MNWLGHMYRAGLWILPPSFRRQWGAEMASEAMDSLSETVGTRRFLALIRLAVDLGWTAVREWHSISLGRVGREDRSLSGVHGDLRYAVRSFRRTPMMTLLVVGTLALGIGANSAIFSVVNAVLIRPIPYPEPDRLVTLWPGKLFNLELYDATVGGMASAQAVSLFSGTVMTLTEGDATELFGAEVTTNHFAVTGVAPAMGRPFLSDDGAPGAPPVAILSHGLWSRQFGSDPDILGRSIALQSEGAAHRTVVGVMPVDYRDLLNGAEAWIPVIEDRASDTYGQSSFAEGAARLLPDASLEVARSEMISVARALQEAQPGLYSETEVRLANVLPMADRLVGSLRTNLLALLGAVGVVLLIACSNVANLLLVRGASRVREIGVRTALGASRGRLLRQHLIESLVLSTCGGLLGLLVAYSTLDLLIGSLPPGYRMEEAGLDPAVLLFTVAMSLGAGLLFGIVPAIRASTRGPASALEGGRGADGSRRDLRIRNAFVTGEIALALVAVFSAGILVQSVRSVMQIDPGFTAEHALTLRLTAAPAAFATDQDVLTYFQQVEAAVASVPGVIAAGATGRLPLDGGVSRITIFPEGFEPDESGELPDATHRLVTSGYAEAMDFRLIEGRFPNESSFRSGPIEVFVTRGLAERFFPDGAIGKRFLGRGGVTLWTVSGVVEDVREDDLEAAVMPGIYLPHRDWAWRTMNLVVRTQGDPFESRAAVESAVRSVSTSVPISRVRSMEDVVLRSVRGPLLMGRLFTLLGALALLLGAVGVYGVMAYSLSQRRREFGIRIALGASRSQVVRRALSGGIRPLAFGVAAGAALTIPAGRVLAGAIEGVQSENLGVLIGTSLVLTTVVALATALPAHAGTRVDPAEPLRDG